MTKTQQYTIAGLALLALLILPSMSGMAAIMSITDRLIPGFESFSAHPYWDVSRWSWGYGTQAPGGAGTISRNAAIIDMRERVHSDYEYLSPLIARPLKPNQWAALLSFSYNLGIGNADNLVPNINSGNNRALETQWKKYVYADGKIKDSLVSRRNREWLLWNS